jgi:hypothetical protein
MHTLPTAARRLQNSSNTLTVRLLADYAGHSGSRNERHDKLLHRHCTLLKPIFLFGYVQVVKITKIGPTAHVTSGQSFTFELRARFESGGPFPDATIVDDLPAGLLPGAGSATWVGSNNAAGGRVNGSESAS